MLESLDDGMGVANRFSDTLQQEMVYVAMASTSDHWNGVIRTSMPLAHVDQVVGQLRTLMLVAGVLGLLVAALMSMLSSYLLTRQLQNIVHRARRIVSHRDLAGDDELQLLTMSLDRLEHEVEQMVKRAAGERDSLEVVLEGMEEGVISLDRDHNILMVNRSARGMLRRDTDVEGSSIYSLLAVSELEEMLEELEPGEPIAGEFVLPGTARRRILMNATQARSGQNIILVLHDVTRLRRLERMRQDFVANVSHELRTPASVIRANAETLMDGAIDDPEAAERFLNAILRNADRLSRIISDLLALSRIENGQMPFEIGPIAVDDIVMRTIESVRHTIADSDALVTTELDADVQVLADFNALEQILVNLLENAVKYGGEGARVIVRCRRVQDDRLRFEIEDDGPGIPEKHRGPRLRAFLSRRRRALPRARGHRARTLHRQAPGRADGRRCRRRRCRPKRREVLDRAPARRSSDLPIGQLGVARRRSKLVRQEGLLPPQPAQRALPG